MRIRYLGKSERRIRIPDTNTETSDPKAAILKKQNKITFKQRITIYIPVFVVLGVVAYAAREFLHMDWRVTLPIVDVVMLVIAAAFAEWSVGRIYKKDTDCNCR